MDDLKAKLKQLNFSDDFIKYLEDFDKGYMEVQKLEFSESQVDQTSNDLTELIIREKIEPQTKNFIISQV